MPIIMLPVEGVVFKLESTPEGEVKISWLFHEKKHAVTGKTVPEAMENAVMAATALIRQGGLL